MTEGLYAMGLTDMPYRDTLSPMAQGWFDRYKDKLQGRAEHRRRLRSRRRRPHGHRPRQGRQGPDPRQLREGLESIRGYRDIFNGPEATFGPDKHQGANSSFLAVVKGGRWVRVTEPLSF